MVILRTMADGSPHPKTRQKIITHKLDPSLASSEWWGEPCLNGSRLGIVFRPIDPDDNRFSVVVWDWTTGEIVLVCRSHKNTSGPIAPTHPFS